MLLPLCVLGCHRAQEPLQALRLPQTSGTVALPDLTAPVRVVRDRGGVPHIYASTAADLFVAQGFVQAQDRLFQMDLWRRAAQGRLAEILGANFVDRDAMTRRIQYRGDTDVEWASYGADARAIAEAFVRGINAYVSIARDHPTAEFVAARWPPAYWRADDLLNRTDAFLESGDALDEIRRGRLPEVVAGAVRLVGTAPFLAGPAPPGALTLTRTPTEVSAATGRVSVSEARVSLSAPAARYLVHLVAPGWDVIGATVPWLPGVAVGHNDRVAWAMAPIAVDTQHILVEPTSAVTAGRQELIRIKGRADMLPFSADTTRDGLVVASDREHRRVFVLRWRGFEPGMAAGLGALAIDRARDWPSFREAVERWRMPARRIVYSDVDGHVDRVDAAPGPSRRGAGDSWVDGASAAPTADDRALFPHLLRRFDVGPVQRPSDDAPLRMTIDVGAWDRTRAIAAPGQSGVPASPHYADAVPRWAAGGEFELWFSEDAVRANADATLTLTPALRQ